MITWETFEFHPKEEKTIHFNNYSGSIQIDLLITDRFVLMTDRIPKLAIVVLGVHYEPLNSN